MHVVRIESAYVGCVAHLEDEVIGIHNFKINGQHATIDGEIELECHEYEFDNNTLNVIIDEM